jgi:putative membrane protein
MERTKPLKQDRIIFFAGLIGHIITSLRPLMLSLTPYMLFLMGLLVIYLTLIRGELKLLIWCLIIYILTFILEAAGVKSGMIFGSYSYGDTLGLKLLGVPLIIGFNWVIVILGAVTIAEQIDQNIFLTALFTGTLSVLFDIMMEPVAIKLHYWEWNSGLIPVSNYYSWFGISFMSSLLYDLLKIKTKVKLPEIYFTIQLIFFILLSLFI